MKKIQFNGWVAALAAGLALFSAAHEPVRAADAGEPDTALAPARPAEPAAASAMGKDIRTQPKRLKDYGIAGLDNVVNLKSLDPWDVVQLIEFLAYRGGINNIVIGKGVAGLTTKLKFDNVTVGDALEVVLSVNNLAFEVHGGIVTIMSDEEYKTQHGASFYDQKQVRVVDLKFADATRVANMLQALKSSIGTIVPDGITGTLILIDTPAKIAEMLEIVRKADLSTVARVVPTEDRTFKLQYADVEAMKTEIQPLLTPELGAVRADKRTRSLIVTDLPHKLAKVEALVRVFDTRQKQVFIEAKIVEVSLSEDFRMGVNWDYLFEGMDPRFQLGAVIAPAVGSRAGGFTPPEGVGRLTYRTIVGGSDLQSVLAALQTVGNTRILSNPHVAVLSDEEATIKVVRDEPYAEAQLESGTTNVVGESITFIEVGVKLSVTPRINDDGMISMAIKPEVSTVVDQYQAYRTVPVVQRAYAETSVMIKDAETIIIAGMIRNQKSENETGVPFLRRIPLLGLLFKANSDALNTSEIIVFLTPRIITGEGPVLLSRDMKKQPKPLRAVGGTGKPAKPVR